LHEIYDERYFERGWRESGSLVWDHRAQQSQLKLKLNFLERFFDKGRVLFVGCAKGFEVRMARQMGWDAYGTDFSEYAVRNVDPAVRDYVRLADTRELPFEDDSFDVVAGFNSPEHVGGGRPEELRRGLCEVSRIASRGLLFKLSLRHWAVVSCLDPGFIELQPLSFWVEGVERLGKHRFFRAEVGTAPLHAWIAFYQVRKWDEFFGDNRDARFFAFQIEGSLRPS